MENKVIYDNTLDRAETAVEAYQYDLATALAKIAEARATERQAAALERIAAAIEAQDLGAEITRRILDYHK